MVAPSAPHDAGVASVASGAGAEESAGASEGDSSRVSHGERRVSRALKTSLKQLIQKQIRKIKDKQTRLDVANKNRTSALSVGAKGDASVSVPPALEKSFQRLTRQVATAQAQLDRLKTFDTRSHAATIWNNLSNRSKCGFQPNSVEELLEKSNLVMDAVERARLDLKAKARKVKKMKQSKKRAAENQKRVVAKRPALDTARNLSKRHAKRASRAEKWRQKQLERERLETKSFRKARAKVSESVFLESLSATGARDRVVEQPFHRHKVSKSRSRDGATVVSNETAGKRKATSPRPLNLRERITTKRTEEKTSGPIHPSWAAKKLQKSGIVGFKGSKITFD